MLAKLPGVIFDIDDYVIGFFFISNLAVVYIAWSQVDLSQLLNVPMLSNQFIIPVMPNILEEKKRVSQNSSSDFSLTRLYSTHTHAQTDSISNSSVRPTGDDKT